MDTRRVCLIILDGAGIGPAPDSPAYGDANANTLGHIWEKTGGINIPNLLSLGLGRILSEYLTDFPEPCGAYGKMVEKSVGKDTTTGHWEIAGLVTESPFPVFPGGFPPELINRFEMLIGSRCLGNKPASGTEIIAELGPEHCATGMPIVYTSGDSVFQIAAHTAIVPLGRLYEMCAAAREMLTGKWSVARVIARPFTGSPGSYIRTDQRKDFSLAPPRATILDLLCDSGQEVVSVGKIEDIFAGRGLTRAIHTHDNNDGVRVLIEELQRSFSGLVFVNLVDFDMKFGHRRDVPGFAKALEEFDRQLPAIQNCLCALDSLIVTADHGNDPVHQGTDHTREMVPLLGWGRGFPAAYDMGTRNTFADVAATVAELLSVKATGIGASFAFPSEEARPPDTLT